jgi:cytochrome c peroxidase
MARYQCDVDITDAEVDYIVAFLRTLTGEYHGKKLTNPNEYGVVLAADYDHYDH